MTSIRRSHALLAAGVVCSAMGCGADAAETNTTPEPEPEFPPPASAFLDPSSYDCTLAGSVVPPVRPHAPSCFADPQCDARLVAGHRMATPFAPENSLSALRAAILLGVDIVETDIRLSADGTVLLIHDGSVDRTLQGSGEVDQLSAAAIAAMPMRETTAKGDFSCDRVPTLDTVFAISKGNIVVELEVKDTEAGILAAEYLRDHDLYGDAFLLCSSAECAAVRAAVPDVPIMSRPDTPEEVAAETAYVPPPILVHIDDYDIFLVAPVLDSISAVGAKPYANAFISADIEALSDGHFEAYVEMYQRGLQVVQTELPHYALVGLGRLDLPTSP